MTLSALPLDDIRQVLRNLPHFDAATRLKMSEAYREASLGGQSLGKLKELGIELAVIRGHVPPLIGKAGVALYGATHGFGGSETETTGRTQRQVEAIAAGAAPVSHLCVANDLALNVFDLALDLPSGDIRHEDALDERSCAATMAFGMEATADGFDILGIGALGGQSEIAAATLLSALWGEPDIWFEDETERQIGADALSCHSDRLGDPLEALRRLGGRDIAALAGAILAARTQNIVIVLDGLAALAAAAVLHKVQPDAVSHCFVAGADSERERQAARRLNLEPLTALEIGTAEGAGAALGISLLKSAAALAGGMAEIARRA